MTKAAIAALVVLSVARAAWAQDTTITIRPAAHGAAERLARRQLPRDVADDVIRLFNAESTIRLTGSTRIPAGRGVDGDLAVLGGPVVVGGRVSGALVVVNGDVVFDSGAVVDGPVLVVGGTVQGAGQASIHGEVRSYSDPLRYRRQGDQLVYAPERVFQPPRWIEQYGWGEDQANHAGILLALAGTYNRVEGLPILLGPRADLRVADQLRFQADATAIFRTSDISFASNDIGYRAHAEFVLGSANRSIGLGLRGYDIVAPVESWPLKEFEVGWASFLFHRDYRDYYQRHGGSLYATLQLSPAVSFTVEGRDERESSLDARTPWSLFRTDEAWRVNPAITDGKYRSAVASFHIDTRNDRGTPSAGWFVTGEYELGHGGNVTGDLGPFYCAASPCIDSALADGKLGYERIAFDARRYLRLSPTGRLNLRLAGGGWVGGDPLPLQRRLSLGYPDPLPGYGFRQFSCNGNELAGDPALCDRTVVAQAEFRTHLGFDFGPKWASDWGDSGDEHYEPFHVSGPDLVVFADAGRAWSVPRNGSAGPDIIPADKLPALSTFRTDVGVGLDFGPLGFYLAKPLDQANLAVTFTVRMGRRF